MPYRLMNLNGSIINKIDARLSRLIPSLAAYFIFICRKADRPPYPSRKRTERTAVDGHTDRTGLKQYEETRV